MIIYLDAEFRCRTSDESGTLTPVETDYFDGKCAELIEGYRFVPAGQTWTREDGAIFEGEMIAPWKPYAELDAAQRAYEQAQLADMRAALEILGVNVDG